VTSLHANYVKMHSVLLVHAVINVSSKREEFCVEVNQILIVISKNIVQGDLAIAQKIFISKMVLLVTKQQHIVIKGHVKPTIHSAKCYGVLMQKKASDVCFALNRKKGSVWANCGINGRGDYIACNTHDALCGKLQCAAKSPDKTLPVFPIIGTRRGRNIVTLKDGTTCILGKTMSPDLQDPSLTDDGVKCANNSICVENKCLTFSSLTYIKNCSRTCLLNGGVCNNKGNCHCPKGLACPYCELAGPGGSADSGQGCILHDNCEDCFSTLFKTLLIIFFLVIPIIILIITIRYRVKVREHCMQQRVTKYSRKGEWTVEEMSINPINSPQSRRIPPLPRRPPVPPPPIIITPSV